MELVQAELAEEKVCEESLLGEWGPREKGCCSEAEFRSTQYADRQELNCHSKGRLGQIGRKVCYK